MSDSQIQETTKGQKPITPIRCLTGGAISGIFAMVAYKLMISIAQTYATKPVNFTNQMTVNIATAVRTLVIGITALATSVFGMVTLGLFALAIKLIFEKLKPVKNEE